MRMRNLGTHTLPVGQMLKVITEGTVERTSDPWRPEGWGSRARSQCRNDKVSRMRKGLPWWRSGWGSACQCRGRGFEPWSGRIPHAAEQLGP